MMETDDKIFLAAIALSAAIAFSYIGWLIWNWWKERTKGKKHGQP